MTLPNTNRLEELQKELSKIFEDYGDPFKPMMGWYNLIFVRWQVFDVMSDIELEKARLRVEKYRTKFQVEDQHPKP